MQACLKLPCHGIHLSKMSIAMSMYFYCRYRTIFFSTNHLYWYKAECISPDLDKSNREKRSVDEFSIPKGCCKALEFCGEN